MVDKKVKNNKSKRVGKRVTDYYQALSKRNRVFTMVLLSLVLICCLSVVYFYFINNQYAARKADYAAELTTLQQEKEDIESGKTVPETKSFDEVVEDNLAGLKDYPQREDNYTVSIKGTDSAITINKNNVFVSDNAQMLNSVTKSKIYNYNRQLAASTNGAQLVVITVNELPDGEDIESYANTIFNQLGIGNKEEDNGVLYLIALEDREFRLEVGYGLEGLIPDSKADDIINNDTVVDAFKDERYDQAVGDVTQRVFNLMNTKTALVDSKINQVKDASLGTSLIHWGMLSLMLVIVVICGVLSFGQLRNRKFLKQRYNDYQEQVSSYSKKSGVYDNEALLLTAMKQTDLYFIMLSGLYLGFSLGGLKRAIAQGKLLKEPGAKKMGMGRILIGDTLYSGNGTVLTHAYLRSAYHSDSSSGSSGGSSWGGFGGGSSGGGGASGGW